jgi:hypothetical protein
LEKDGGVCGEEDSKPSLVTSSAQTGSCPGQEVVQEEATPKSGRMAARTNQIGNAAGSWSSLERDGGRNETDSKLSLVTSSALTGSCPGQEVVREEARPGQIPSGWTHAKLEPDC